MNGHPLRLVLRLAPLAALVLLALPHAAARAQDTERPGEHGDSDYAWHADDAEAPSDPSRLLLSVGAGASLRIVKNLTLQQDQFAPAFVDVFGAFVFPGSGWRHGVGLLLSTNITGDGGDPNGFDPLGQFFAGAEYVAYFRLSDDFVVDGHVGPLFGTSGGGDGGPSVGLELALSASYLLFAGLGIYVEGSASAFLGATNTVHPLVSIEGGLFIDYEVLP